MVMAPRPICPTMTCKDIEKALLQLARQCHWLVLQQCVQSNFFAINAAVILYYGTGHTDK
eukprot:2699122-Amphidinium_carterae.1